MKLPPITVDAARSTDGSNSGGGTTINVVTTPLNIVLAGVTVSGGHLTAVGIGW